MNYFENYENSSSDTFTEFQKAMEDTVVIAAAHEAKKRADDMNAGMSEMSADAIAQHINELDMMIHHVVGTQVALAGQVQLSERGDDSPFFITQEIPGLFQGFTYSIRGEKLNFDFLFAVPVRDDTDELLTVEEINDSIKIGQEIEYTTRSVQAVPGDIFIEFGSMHPVRAKAILEMTYPDTLRDVDDRIVHLSDTFDEDAVLSLRGFKVTVNEAHTLHDNETYMKALTSYINSLITIDKNVPYLLTVDGICITNTSDGDRSLVPTTVKGQLMTVEAFGFYSQTTDGEGVEEFGLGFRGVWHDNNQPEAPTIDVILPIESLVSFRSLQG